MRENGTKKGERQGENTKGKQFKEATLGTHRASRTGRQAPTSLAVLPIQAWLLRWIPNPTPP